MARTRTIQNNFTSGELSPRMEGRSDFPKYQNAVKTMENLIPLKFGGAVRRPGTRFVAEAKDSTKKTRLIPFEFNDTQAYIVEVGNLYMRFYRNGGRIESPPLTPVEIVTPYLEAELFDLQFAQSADVMWITHRNHQPRKLTRTSHTAWSLTLYAPTYNPFTSSGDFPRSVAFFQERLGFAGTDNDPQTVWLSKSGDFEDQGSGTGADSDAIKITIASGKVNVIQWIAQARGLMIGTLGGEFQLTGGGVNDAVTPSNVIVKDEGTRGSALLQPIKVGNILLFLQRVKRKLRELVFSFDVDNFVSPDLSVLAEHITEGGITQMDYQQELQSTVWLVRSDG